MKRWMTWALFAGLLTANASAAQPAGDDVLSSAVRVGVELVGADAENLYVKTTIDGEDVTLFLTPYSVRTDDFEVWVQGADGGLQKLAAPPAPKTYRGSVVEWDAAPVAATWSDGRLTAEVRSADRGRWFVEPGGDAGAPLTEHVAYRADQVQLDEQSCGVSAAMIEERVEARELERDLDADPTSGAAPGATTGERGGAIAAEISFDADVEFFQLNGSSVTATVDDIERVMLGVDNIYRAEVGIKYIVNRIVVRTAQPDPYTSSDPDTLRNQFRSEWENNFAGQERDIAHLMTGRDLDDTTIGIAFIGEVCNRDGLINSGAYGLSQSRFSNAMASRVALTAHELGHNWDATHCNGDADCAIMCSGLGGCTGILTQFGASARNDIIDHRDSRECLGGFENPTFVDDSNNTGFENGSVQFPYNTFREGVWATDTGGRVVFFGGMYDADRTAEILNRPMVLEVQPGTGSAVITQ